MNRDAGAVFVLAILAASLSLVSVFGAGMSIGVFGYVGVALGVFLGVLFVYYGGLFISRWHASLAEITKFCMIGILNTFLDIALMNAFMYITHITTGPYFSLSKVGTFAVSVTNSYLWNKYWTFNNSAPSNYREFVSFVVANVGGMMINVAVASFMVNVFDAPDGITPVLWADIAIFCSIAASLSWNFVTQKYFVFRKLV